MKVLVSEKLSEHKYKTPEGYLICTDAILARTGKQTYTKDELFCDGDNTEVNVDRPYDEVMNAKTIASFENKPITFDHPDEDVNVGNYKSYSVGYVRDVRQGKTDKGEDVILGNLVITDQDAINAIEQGDHTDLSCGYDCDIKDDGNGNYSQTNIRGNHLALCEQGRAGIAHIADSKMKDAGNYSWFKRYINGDLQSYNIDSLINNVKSKKQPLHTNLAGKSGNVYTVFIDGSLKSNLDNGSDMWIDIIVEKPNGQQKRLLSEKFNSWNECQKIFNAFKNRIRDSADDITRIDDSKVEDDDESWFEMLLKRALKEHEKEFSSDISPMVANRVAKKHGVKISYIRNSKEYLYKYTYIISDSKVEDSIRDMSWKTPGKRVPVHNEYSNSLKPEEMKSKLEKAAKDNKVDILRGILQELIADVDADLSNTSLDKDETIKHYNKYYATLRKANVGNMQGDVDSCLRELKRSGIHDSKEMSWLDSKVEDAEYTYKLTKKKNDYDEYVIQAYKNGKKNEDATYYTDDWDDAINTLKSIAKQEKLTFRQQGSVFIVDNKAKAFNDSKEMTMSDAIKMLNIVDAYKKVRDDSKNEWVIKNTGLAYEIWNRGKMVKKFPTKKLAIEWIHSRFPTDEITEDSTKDDRLWQTLTRKSKT